jgi:hypothetical protein
MANGKLAVPKQAIIEGRTPEEEAIRNAKEQERNAQEREKIERLKAEGKGLNKDTWMKIQNKASAKPVDDDWDTPLTPEERERINGKAIAAASVGSSAPSAPPRSPEQGRRAPPTLERADSKPRTYSPLSVSDSIDRIPAPTRSKDMDTKPKAHPPLPIPGSIEKISSSVRGAATAAVGSSAPSAPPRSPEQGRRAPPTLERADTQPKRRAPFPALESSENWQMPKRSRDMDTKPRAHNPLPISGSIEKIAPSSMAAAAANPRAAAMERAQKAQIVKDRKKSQAEKERARKVEARSKSGPERK